jgi:hypothetical protein
MVTAMRTVLKVSGILLFLCLGVTCTASSSALRVGISRVDITPQQPVELAGYAARKDLSTGVHDRLSARAVVFARDDEKIVLLSTDGIGFYDGTFEFVRDSLIQELKVDPKGLFLSAIHTHSAPRVGLDATKRHPNNVAYTRDLRSKIVACIQDAFANLRPVEIGVAVGHSPVGVNRRERQPDGSIRLGRNPAGPHDKEVLVMRLQDLAGKPIGLLFDYATHATSLGAGNLEISGDLLGLAEQFAEATAGEDIVAAAFVGASGDIDPWYRVLPGFNAEPGWTPETELLGKLLGVEVVRVFRGIDRFESDLAVGSTAAEFEVPGREASEEEPESHRARNRISLTAAHVGDIAFLGINAEVLTEVGLAIKRASPFKHTFIITHCNGAAGYLPPKHLYGEGGYEITTSPFGPEAAELVVRKATKMLRELSDSG